MSKQTHPVSIDSGDRVVSGRELSAAVSRCMAYAVMSDLLASPHDVESVVYNNSDTIDSVSYTHLTLPTTPYV